MSTAMCWLVNEGDYRCRGHFTCGKFLCRFASSQFFCAHHAARCKFERARSNKKAAYTFLYWQVSEYLLRDINSEEKVTEK